MAALSQKVRSRIARMLQATPRGALAWLQRDAQALECTPVGRRLARCAATFERALAERDAILQEAVGWAQEARTYRAIVRECYRAVTGGRGEPGAWNGARPVIEELRRLRVRCERLDRELAGADDTIRRLGDELSELQEIRDGLVAGREIEP